MKIRTFLLLTLLVVAGGFTNRVHAQYQSFFGDSITEYSIGGNYVAYDPNFFGVRSYHYSWTHYDTISINGNQYFSINSPYPDWFQSDPHIYLREDTVYGRVYRYNPEFDYEQLTCDMSLEVGDTFVYPYSPLYFGFIENPFDPAFGPAFGIVDSVWYENGKKFILFPRETWFIASSEDQNQYFENEFQSVLFIEGIGPNYSTFGWGEDDVACYGRDNVYPILLCVHKDGELVYMADERAGCVQYPPAKIEENENPAFQLYPNPVSNSLSLQFKGTTIPEGMVYITNAFGCVVRSQRVEDAHLRINVRNLPAGIYIATYFEKGKMSSQKFIKK